MSKAIEAMKEEGWEQLGALNYDQDSDVVSFRRPKQKPNAVVDWEDLEKYLSDLQTGNGFSLGRVYSGVGATLQNIAEDIERLIKKAP